MLLTSQFPQGVDVGALPVPFSSDSDSAVSSSSTLISHVASVLCPRYHFTSFSNTAYVSFWRSRVARSLALSSSQLPPSPPPPLPICAGTCAIPQPALPLFRFIHPVHVSADPPWPKVICPHNAPQLPRRRVQHPRPQVHLRRCALAQPPSPPPPLPSDAAPPQQPSSLCTNSIPRHPSPKAALPPPSSPPLRPHPPSPPLVSPSSRLRPQRYGPRRRTRAGVSQAGSIWYPRAGGGRVGASVAATTGARAVLQTVMLSR